MIVSIMVASNSIAMVANATRTEVINITQEENKAKRTTEEVIKFFYLSYAENSNELSIENRTSDSLEISSKFAKQIKSSNNEISLLSSSNDLTSGDYTYTVSGNNATITGYTGLDENLAIPNKIEGYTITSIASKAFSGCDKIKSVILPDGLQSIGYGAFSSSYITSITIPKGLTSAGYYEPNAGGWTYAFSNCSQLQTIIFEDGMKKIPNYLARGVKSLKRVEMPDSVTEIGEHAFQNCQGLEEIQLSSNLKTIGDYAFLGSGLKRIELPDGLQKIQYDAFYNCESLETVNFADNITSIGSGAFDECNNLKNVILPDGLQSIGYGAFSSPYITSITIPKGLTSAGYYEPNAGGWTYAFSNCSQLQTIIFEDGMKKIPNYLAREVKSLKRVEIPGSVTEIGEHAFHNCTNLEQVDFTDSITRIDGYAFHNCNMLKNVILPSNLESIGWSACTSPYITSITIPKTLTSVSYLGDYDYPAFNCSNLETMKIEDGMEKIPGSLARGVKSLKSIEIPKSVTEIGNNAFYECDDFSILGYSNSYAERYASENNIPFVSIGILEPDNSDKELFNEYIYRANHLTDTEEVEGTTMENGYINTETPSEILLKELQKNGFSYTADAWRAVTRTCDSASDASKIVDYAVEEKDIYEAIILNALENATKYDVVNSINADVIKETNELLQIIKNDLKVNYSIDIYDSTQNTNLTKEMRVRTKELAEEYYEQKDISKAADWLGNFEEVMAYLDTAEDFCEELTSYMNIRNMNDSMKSVLKEMKNNCPSNNKALASALDDCVKILDTSDSEFAKQMLEGGLKTVGTEAAKAGISKFWGEIVVAKVEKLCPRVVIIKAAYKTSKYLTNLVFNADEITEKYYKLIATTEFDSLIRNTYSSLKNTYVKGKNVENAKAYLSAIDVMFNAISSDCDSAYAYVDSIDSANLSKICKLFGCSSNNSSLKSSIESIKKENNNEHELILTAWVNYLPEDFPEEYPHYTRLFEEGNKRLKEYQIHCPVDVYVYDSANRLVASVINNIPSSSGLAVIVDGDEKTLYLPEGEQYSISYIGNGAGVMDIEVAEFDVTGTITRTVNFNNISLSKGVKYSSNENGKFLEDAEYNIVNSNGQNQKADFDSYSQEKKEKHTITIEQGTMFDGEMPFHVIEAYENQVLDISAYVPAGYELDKWKVSSGSIEIKDVSNVNTKIIVGSEDATITAILKGNLPSESPKPTDKPDIIQTPKPTDNPNTTLEPSQTTKPDVTENLTPTTDVSNATNSPLKGELLKDNKSKMSYKVITQGKTVAFYKPNNKRVMKIVIPATVTISGIKYKVTAISDNAFSGCKKLKSVTIGKYVTSIGNKAFSKCTSLKKIIIPASVKKIGKKAFYGCKKLKSITIKTKKLKSKSVGTQAFKGIYKKAVIKVPKKQKKAYTKWLKKKGITKKMKIK